MQNKQPFFSCVAACVYLPYLNMDHPRCQSLPNHCSSWQHSEIDRCVHHVHTQASWEHLDTVYTVSCVHLVHLCVHCYPCTLRGQCRSGYHCGNHTCYIFQSEKNIYFMHEQHYISYLSLQVTKSVIIVLHQLSAV